MTETPGHTMVAKKKDCMFNTINECEVEDITLEFFYKPHTITLLILSIAAVLVICFIRDDNSIDDNIWAGIWCVIFFLLIVSLLAFPNGPFVRPHPAVWRMVFGLSVLYSLTLLFLLFQKYETIKGMILWLDPNLKDFRIDMDKEYGVNCSDINVEKFWAHLDVFAGAHFFGWVCKAILVRHYGILWSMSIMWEITEVTFSHLLPNFKECWWDAWVLDVLLCNGIGIWVGMRICKMLEMRNYNWPGIKEIDSTGGKIKRAALQFTPASWTPVRWLDPSSSYMRIFAVCQMVIMWQVSELNTFFLKHLFEMPPSHPIVGFRLLFLSIVVAPSTRQYYTYVTDPNCKRLGTQCWVYTVIMITELLLCIKNGKELFQQTEIINISLWFVIMLFFSVISVLGFWQADWLTGKKLDSETVQTATIDDNNCEDQHIATKSKSD
ncbi:phosphatidylserine synthase [Adelges cooleyi]|uniref:phosphatidylserine synthase n=1 Tax=Adelges cooleyi TaxID=133065 RepID=UPI00217F862D|nr:phosphatidylserine synthase [Adelges cooleyi]